MASGQRARLGMYSSVSDARGLCRPLVSQIAFVHRARGLIRWAVLHQSLLSLSLLRPGRRT